VSLIMQRRGIIMRHHETTAARPVEAEVPLAEMFGFSTVLRSATQGKAEFTMEFAKYRRPVEHRRGAPGQGRQGQGRRQEVIAT
jgi:translation elongation factor EF-G